MKRSKPQKISIKARVTLWYTGLMMVLVLLVMAMILSMSRVVAEAVAKQQLEESVDNAAQQLIYQDDTISFKEEIAFYDQGSYLMFYDAEYHYLGGRWPSGFPDGVVAADLAFRAISVGTTSYYLYDRYVPFDQGGVWIRGIYEANGAGRVVNQVVRLLLVALPMLVALAAVGGWFITKNAFRVVEELNTQAEQISGGRDLSKRISLGDGNDEIHRLARTLDRMFERLEESFRAEKQFTSDVAHELRTPTAVILAECDYALSSKAPEDMQEALETIQRQSRRMSRMTEQMLSLSRMERNQENIEWTETDLTELIEMVCEEQRELMPEGMKLKTALEPVMTEVNQDLMIRMAINLLSNAVRYGGTWVRVSLECQQGQVFLSVEDDGIGIAQEEQEKIFQRFYQVSSARTRDGKSGTGLGLSMVAQIVRLHQGTIAIDSALGKGSCFTVSFPQKREEIMME